MKDTHIELKLLEPVHKNGRLPVPIKQKEIRKGDILLTIPDFAYETEKLAIFCDGFAYHGSKDVLASDSQKRNELQADGWAVLTFWGKQSSNIPNVAKNKSGVFGRRAKLMLKRAVHTKRC